MLITALDDVLDDPLSYRQQALKMHFRTYDFGHCQFHGIAVGPETALLVQSLQAAMPSLAPSLTFFRKSPAGQVEPHFIHSDIDMGEWSCVYYLNPAPPEGDGTTFWRHKESGEIGNREPHLRSVEGRDADLWEATQKVQAKFNRLVLFRSDLFHSRSLPENWGERNEARLTQVIFGKGQL